MKYPQLVSTRAVNAISDWLVSRLEQLGVEAPLLYSRLLLSLLHSSVQINDPIEFSNLESYLANRKGNKRIPRCDSDALKKITAVQCLMDTVSSEQEITKIENLVDELCDRLSDIEKQNSVEELPQEVPTTKSADTEDPRKRYYRAFPALSKEMDDTLWAARGKSKALTWPTINSATNSYQNSLNSTAGVKRKPKRRRNQGVSRPKTANTQKNTSVGNISPTWDTDFEGSWEMGRDLIKEFIVKQNNRNRSTSESDACNIRQLNELQHEKRMKPTIRGEDDDFYGTETKAVYQTENFLDLHDNFSSYSEMQPSEISTHAVSDEGYSTTEGLNSLSETDGTSSVAARRLYQRDISVDSLSMQSEFAQLKAKFNSNVEALWKNNNDGSSLPPNHQNLENFWTNYYNHCFDVNKFDNSASNNNSNDFFSMPSDLGKINNTLTTNINKPVAESSSVFLQDSIWSDQSTKTHGEDTDFYTTVIGSVLFNDITNEGGFYDKDSSYSFNMAAKWSECSFETPLAPSSSAGSSTEQLPGSAKTDLRENMLKNSYLYNRRQPIAPASNILKNTSDSSAHSLFSGTHGSINKGEKHTYKQSMSSKSSVTLLNHSSNSKFMEYSRLKSVFKLEKNYKLDLPDDCRNAHTLSTSHTDDENLLTSERTHFRPIKQNYADGHEFDIPNAIDDIKFTRSESGFLYYESEKYLEYTRMDIFVSEDDLACMSNSEHTVAKSDKIKNEFVLKFRVKQLEKYCQTDPSTNVGFSMHSQESKTSNNKYANDPARHGSFANLTNFNKVNMDQWSMAEIGKKCVDNNNTHTLWGMCSACNNGMRSMPANRLLKDELTIEGDKIMSDLKYMQDLYIGSDWEDEDTDSENNAGKDCELYQSMDDAEGGEEQEHILYNVTKFIADLLKPENAKSLANALGASQNFKAVCTDDIRRKNLKTSLNEKDCSNNNNNEYVGGLWSNDENIIWKRELKPINDNILSRLNNNKTSSFLEKLNWEYSNLAEIWKRASQSEIDPQKTPSNFAKSKHIDHKNHCCEISNKNLVNVISLNISQQNCKSFDSDHNYVHNFSNKVVNRFDRKRRHSASQNIISATGSNDFYDNVIIGNKIEVMTTQELDYGRLMNDSPATIITCKYWTTLDTTSASKFFTDKGSQYDGISTLAMNPSSILKHVAVVSRPLTR